MKIIKFILAIIMTMSLLFSGCAKKSDQIAAKYVSPAMYNSYDCEQVNMERQRLSNRQSELETGQDKAFNVSKTSDLIL